MGDTVSVTFLPSGIVADVAPGSTVLEAAVAARTSLPAPCGGRGKCGRCAVRVVEGSLAPPDEHELAALARVRASHAPVRLACRACIEAPVVVQLLGRTAATHATGGPPGGARALAAAVDLGTTTVAVRLLDVTSGMVVAESVVSNGQVNWGADVLSRITAALEGHGPELSDAALDSITEALSAATEAVGPDGSPVKRVVIAANPAMASLLTGAEVAGLASHPFSSALHAVDTAVLARSLGVDSVLVVPPVAAFVGGDLVAGLLSVGLAEGADGVLYVDIGTNAEVAFALSDRILVSSAPAGPAFEGWGIACGGTAGEGGVKRVDIDRGEPMLLYDGPAPTHLTGSGLLSAIAALRASGQVDAGGLLSEDGPLARRIFDSDGVRAVSLGREPGDRSLFLTQLDIRAFQSAKAAVASAVRSVVSDSQTDVAPSRAIVSGAFGGAIDTDHLVALGVLPRDVEGRIEVVADAVLSGASDMAFDPGLVKDAHRLVARAHHVDLAASEGFSVGFVEALALEPFTL